MHFPVIGHRPVDVQALQQTDDVIRLLDSLLNGNSLREKVHARFQPRVQSAANVFLIAAVGIQAACAVASVAHPNHGKVNIVIGYSIPVHRALIGGNVHAVASAELITQILQAVRLVKRPRKI